MALQSKKAIAIWRDIVFHIEETRLESNRYRFHNFSGERLTKGQLIKLLTSNASSWNGFKRKQKHSIIWCREGKEHYWIPGYKIDLRDVDLRGADLTDRDLSNIDFSGSNLSGSDFSRSRLDHSDIKGTFTGSTNLADCSLVRSKWVSSSLNYVKAMNADFTRAEFNGGSINNCDLRGAKFIKAFVAADFDNTDVRGTDFKESHIFSCSFFKMDLAAAANMSLANYHGESRIDYQTIKLSQTVPTPLLEACGVAHFHIPYIDSISKNSAKHPSCFISYSIKDEKFIQRFRNQLSNKGVRTWFAPRDLPFGAPTRDEIETQIRSHDRLIVVLSKSSLKSQWVQFEVETALEIERKRGSGIIIPICIDDQAFKSKVSWARHIVRTRNIADHQNWERSDSGLMDEFVRRILKRTRSRRKSKVEA